MGKSGASRFEIGAWSLKHKKGCEWQFLPLQTARNACKRDNSFRTHDGGYASEGSFCAYSGHIRATGLAVRTHFNWSPKLPGREEIRSYPFT